MKWGKNLKSITFIKKKSFLRALLFLVVYVICVILLPKNLELELSVLGIIALAYIGVEVLVALIHNGNYLVIFGFIILLTSLITFVMGWWDEDSLYISKPFILAIAAIATFFTFKDLLDVADFSDKTKMVLNILGFIALSISIILVLMITYPPFVKEINKMNTDYLTFVSLGIAMSTMGLRQQKK